MDQNERAKFESLTLEEISDLIKSGTVEGSNLEFLQMRKGFLIEKEIKNAPAIEALTLEEITDLIESGKIHGTRLENLRERKNYLLDKQDRAIKRNADGNIDASKKSNKPFVVLALTLFGALIFAIVTVLVLVLVQS